jgi:hypothetical protein
MLGGVEEAGRKAGLALGLGRIGLVAHSYHIHGFHEKENQPLFIFNICVYS